MAAGCTHFIIGRDMAGCKSTLTGEDFYGPYDAQDNAKAHAKELGMDTVPSLNITYTEVSQPAKQVLWTALQQQFANTGFCGLLCNQACGGR